jgi:hypothetical protein
MGQILFYFLELAISKPIAGVFYFDFGLDLSEGLWT